MRSGAVGATVAANAALLDDFGPESSMFRR
jgi:hypothetical protein